MRFEDEHRSQVQKCVRESAKLAGERFDAFVAALEGSIAAFEKLTYADQFREAHDALRQLWFQCSADNPVPLDICKGVEALPRMALQYVNRRFRRLHPQLAASNAFQEWSANLKQHELPEIQFIVAEGLRRVEGRSRGRGKRSAPHFEPVIMGEARGAGKTDQTGGRPSADARLELVAYLAVDWLSATGLIPKSTRGDKSGFGDLVHRIFGWLDMPDAAEYALRLYWVEAKKREKAKAWAGTGFSPEE